MPPEPKTLFPVQLVGAGPGAADLLTLRAARAIEGAEALLYDALVGEDILAMAPRACLKIQTGKRAGRPSMRQETINRLMIRLARRGLRVVRLKGGDPSIFGRVGEEAQALRQHGLAAEIVPGVTAACAAAAQFGLPLTHRGVARRVVMATATTQDGELTIDWAAAADPEATLAIYMGARAAPEIARRLIAAGRSPETPVAIVENASAPSASLKLTTLARQAAAAAGRDGAAPALILVGDALAASAAWTGAEGLEALAGAA
ncbi:MAG: uroporphyrinogen-III C-methyltransferase [Phenylobacterium sp.]|uniref:uroporphyrinogen-III C-methyltransferase n=1 Tax=Phenylobacterium sp. TaxID=1871053 RepID=UPI0027158420|nr:uroporphyrinogen-III C-methyltransferase [Phenylobacterium sp.]MDO8411067.1 uroporphyrinogen-III C-methyltransferase [Phenylobacterium sp.]